MDGQVREDNKMLRGLMNLSWLMCSVAATGSYAQVSEPVARHDWWEYLNAEWETPAGVPQVTVDGRLLPNWFELPVARAAPNGIAEAHPLSFVLVRPGQVTVDGVELSVERPFYLAVEETSLAQFAELNGSSARAYGDFNEYRDFLIWEARIDNRVPLRALQPLSEYLENPRHPALLVNASSAANRIASLTARTPFTARLPTLSEWFLAARCEEPSVFWWGDSVDESKLVWMGDSPNETALVFAAFDEVSAGVRSQCGFLNMFGNAAELVSASDNEREILRRRGVYLVAAAPISVGGAVNTRGAGFGSLRQAMEHLEAEVSEWTAIAAYQLTEESHWGADIWWTSGLRFAIEIPDGEVRLIDTP
ncbi:MAG: SUMF1/EgtB/PvdO family nonheme iron enzyme [Phycisphaerales bacterium JB039]